MVTGAGSGIGRAVALALAAAGAEVILLGRTVRKLEAVHAEIAEPLGAPEASIVPLDLERALAADYEAVAAAVAEALWPARRPAAQRRLVRRAHAHRAIRSARCSCASCT